MTQRSDPPRATENGPAEQPPPESAAVSPDDDGFTIGRPVADFPIRFRWRTGLWHDLFEKQIALVERDIARARVEDSVMVFQSSPLSGRGGSHFATNVEIADHTMRRLMEEWGHRFWVLNPARYQMESKEGTGLMNLHARELSRERGEEIDVEALFRDQPPGGGDYMRMWTRILVEDYAGDQGGRWDAVYFIGPSDVRHFFSEGGSRTWTAGVEEYFSRRMTMDRAFHEAYAPPFESADGERLSGAAESAEWRRRRDAFFRYYTVRAGVNFSLGSHDEWNIVRILNARRVAEPGGLADQIALFFDGRQVDPSGYAHPAAPGYHVENESG